MRKNEGRITIGDLFVFALVVMAAFMAFKYISTQLEKKAIKKEVVDYLGAARGGHLGDAEAVDHINLILEKHKVEAVDAPSVSIGGERNMIAYSLSYSITTDYVFFKRNETVVIEGEVENYGL